MSDLNNASVIVSKGTFQSNGFTITSDATGFLRTEAADAPTLDISNSIVDVGELRIDGSSMITAANSSITIRYSLIAASQAFNDVTFDGYVSMGASQGNFFQSLNVTGNSTVEFPASYTQTIGALTANGSSNTPITFISTSPGTSYMLSKSTGTVNLFYVNMTDATATGGATFNAYGSTDNGNNTGWNFGTATFYWVSDGGNWKDAAHWSLTSGGASAGTIPDGADLVRFDANSFTAPGQIVTISDDGSLFGMACGGMDWRGVTNNPTFRIRVDSSDWIGNSIRGSLYFDDNMTIDFDKAELYFEGTADYDFDSRNHYLGMNCFIYFNSPAVCNVLSDINHAWLYMAQGTFNLNGYTFLGQNDNYPALWLSGTANVDISNSMLDLGTIQLTSYNSFVDDNATIVLREEFRSANADLNYIQIADTVFSGTGGDNMIQNLVLVPGSVFRFRSGYTQTIGNLIANGTSGNPIALAASADSSATISSTNNIDVHYATISDITATGGGQFKAFNSIDGGNNSGWTFVSNQGDSLALVALYNSTIGTNWTNKTNWLTGPLNTWHGVTTNGDRVTQLNLSGNNLRGMLPGEIVNLTGLTLLDLNSNLIGGEIPATIGNLSNLLVLNLGANRFTGSIPSSIGDILNLDQLMLFGNSLQGAVPSTINNLMYLVHLNISQNQLTDLPALSGLSSIAYCDISYNSFTFEDLEPNVSLSGVILDPQNPFSIPQFVNANGGPLDLSFAVGGSANSYQWLKNDIAIGGEISDAYNRATTSSADEGVYRLQVSNSITGTMIESGDINVGFLESFYWIGNGGNWNDPNHWSTTSGGTSAGVIPSFEDNVTFDANSFTLPDQVVNVPDSGDAKGVVFRTMDWRGVTNNPTFRVRAETSPWLASSVSGSIYLDENMIVDFHHAEFEMTPEIDYDLDLKNHYLGEDCWLAFNYGGIRPGGLGSNVNANVLSRINHAFVYVFTGSLVTNGNEIFVQPSGYFWLNSAVGRPVHLNMTNSTVGGGAFTMLANSTITDDNGTITVNGNYNVQATGIDFNNVMLSSSAFIRNGNTYQQLTVAPGTTLTLQDSSTTVINALNANGTASLPITIQTQTPGAPSTISKASGEINVTYAHIRDNIATGGAEFNAINSFDNGNNAGWNFISPAVLEADSLALIDLYNATAGASWTNQGGWLQPGNPVYQWHGVTVENGRVSQLMLTGNNLIGAVPASIGQLDALTHLDLGGNQLTGALPVELFNLTNLHTLGFAGNGQLTGAIPVELGNLVNLRRLWLDGNNFTGEFPSTIGNLTQLTDFFIQRNNFSGAFPESFGTLTNLQYFAIEFNNFTSFPDISSMSLGFGNIAENYLNFNSLVPNNDVANLTMFPQKNFPGGDVELLTGETLTLTFDAGTGAVYQWRTFLNDISGATGSSLVIENVTSADGDRYSTQATHPEIAGSLFSGNFEVRIISPEAFNESGYTYLDKLGASALGIEDFDAAKLAVAGNGNLFVRDNFTSDVFHLDNTGTVLNSFPIDWTVSASDFEADSTGSLFVSDEINSKVVKFSDAGTVLFNIPVPSAWGIAIDGSQNLLTIGRFDHNIQKYDGTTGAFIETIALTGQPETDLYIDLEVDENGYFYAIIPTYARIDKFNPDGTYASSLDLAALAGVSSNWPGMEFTVSGSGRIFFQEFNGRIHYIDNVGVYQGLFGDGVADRANGIKAAPNGLYVSDWINGLMLFDETETVIDTLGPIRNQPGAFNFVSDISRDKHGDRYVSDYHNGRVQKFGADRTLKLIIGTKGAGTDQLLAATNIALDEDGNIFVSDDISHRIQKYDAAGTHLQTIGSQGTGDGQFNQPRGIAISKTGYLYVVDAGNNRIQKFTTGGVHVLSFGEGGTGVGQLSGPGDIAVENDGSIIVANNDPNNVAARVIRFNENGVFQNEAYWAFPWIDNLATDDLGNIYFTSFDKAHKADKNLNLLMAIGSFGKADGEMVSAGAISPNPAGDTVWVSSYLNRISVFYSNFGYPTAADSTALVDLYNATNGAGWVNNTNWLTGPVNTWYGISVTAGKITAIALPDNNLMGEIPASIGTLNELGSMDLRGNSLTGTVPASVSNLGALQKLNLSGNALEGEINFLPVQVEYLSLRDNQFTGLPTAPAFLKNADVSENDLTAIPNFANSLVDTLNVSDNNLEFDDLEPNVSIPAFSYIPQDSVGEKSFILRELGTSVTIESNFGGTANQYVWNKNGTSMSVTSQDLSLTNLTIEDDAFYNVELTNTTLPGLTLKAFATELRISSLVRDSLALVALYNSTNGTSWTDRTGWLEEDQRLADWVGVTITSSRVTSLDLSANNLSGNVAPSIVDMQSLTTIDLADNNLTSLPNLSLISSLTSLNVANNNLDFASLIPNVTVSGIIYSPQAELGTETTTEIPVTSTHKVKVLTKGDGNVYQWRRNGLNVSGATDSTYTIESINRSNMGTYVARVTNPAVANLTLETAPQHVLATASIAGSFMMDEETPVEAGTLTLLKITDSKYDTTALIEPSVDGSYTFGNVVLADYKIVGFADTNVYVNALPTYYANTIYWEQADTLVLESDTTNLAIVSQEEPVPSTGNGLITGVLEEPEGEDGGRTKANKRVGKAGVAARRVEGGGRDKEVDPDLISYVFTNDNGEFELPNLPAGTYSLNIQYPGYPMDETSDVEITIDDALLSQVDVRAVVEEGKISVKKINITNIYETVNYKVDIYPNPAVDYVKVTFAKESKARAIRVNDMQGNIVVNKPANNKENTVDFQTLAKGVYLMTIEDRGTKVRTVKVVIE
ncbi:MAG TPA: T9SS type A sorting domain-containing protein [Chryseosolibacter sp.]|nr:T9SS type A sorting domain-containing protein [Chryseosolibacter sp.]